MKDTMARGLGLVLLAIALPAVAGANALARLKFEQAEASYADKKFEAALVQAEEAERMLGKTNPPLLHLKILARNDWVRSRPLYDWTDVLTLRKDCGQYMAKFAKDEADIDRTREVLAVCDAAKDFPRDEMAYRLEVIRSIRLQMQKQLQLLEDRRQQAGAANVPDTTEKMREQIGQQIRQLEEKERAIGQATPPNGM